MNPLFWIEKVWYRNNATETGSAIFHVSAYSCAMLLKYRFASKKIHRSLTPTKDLENNSSKISDIDTYGAVHMELNPTIS